MEKEYKFNNSKVRILFGDIMETDAEVIVSSDDSCLSMGGGVSRAILKKCGEGLMEEASKLIPLALGDVAVTSAIGVPQKYIFYAVTLERDAKALGNFEKTVEDDIQCYIIEHSVKKCLQLMRMLNITSIAFPCIGAGTAKIPYTKVAKCMAKAISKVLLATNKELNIEIYLYDHKGEMANFDFLPFFEWFASYSLVAKRELEHEMQIDFKGNADDGENEVEIMDCSEAGRGGHRVFISYSRKDSEAVRGICGILNQLNIPYWIDINGIYSGENYKEVIVQAISQADLVLFVSSINSNQSSNVAKEIGLADKFNRVVIPVRIDNSPFNPKIEYDLSGIDNVDFVQPDEKRVRKLKNAILAHIVMSNKQ